ncbi:hypothetical protein ACIQXW_23330 [Lysinibacillus sp. NPDC097162]|uniref:hypothetical protein n=1 Tax=Lysinibacillus sp. NPDC097162 TaxID=3364140 RepID=UPI00380D2166
MTQLSVKGLTVCTPEFHCIAKRGEELAEIEDKVDSVIEGIDELAGDGLLTDRQRMDLTRTLNYL